MKTWSFLHHIFWGMLMYLQYFILLIPFTSFCMPAVSVLSPVKKPPIYWNSSNPMFNTTTPNITVHLYDSIEIHCPYYSNTSDSRRWEYYVLYLVSEEEYNTCTIHNPNLSLMIINCSNPNVSDLFFTLLVLPFAGIPGVPDFITGNTYHLITTSNGTLGTISNQYQGACHNFNMRVKIHICCSPNSSSTSISTTGSTTSPTGKNTHTSVTTPKITTPTTTQSTTTTTTPAPTTTHTTTTTNYPGGKPSDPSDNLIIVTGDKNNGIINNARTLHPSWTILVLSTVTLTLFVKLLR